MIELLWNNPVSQEKMQKYLAALELRDGQRILDIGCGTGELLILATEQFQSQGLGVDSSSEQIQEANRRAVDRGCDANVSFVCSELNTTKLEADPFDVAVCFGATHAFELGPNAFVSAIAGTKNLVQPGGKILIAEGYLKQPPSPEYRALLGDSVPDEMTHAANVFAGQKAGLVTLGAWTSSVDEWDDFEWGYQRVIERRAAENPDDSSAAKKLKLRREWMEAYLKWGRDTLGFGIYLFQKPV